MEKPGDGKKRGAFDRKRAAVRRSLKSCQRVQETCQYRKRGRRFLRCGPQQHQWTFVNGRRVQGRKPLKEKDVLRIVDTRLIFANGCLYYCSYKRGLGIEAVHLVRTVKNKGETFNICNDVSLSIEPGELVAIIGGSGAGKTTLMNAICGYNRPTSGQVLINGEELYDTYDALKNIIGYVPQQDIVYDNLTLFSMLDYAAKLRLPDDMSEQERRQRVHQVIDIVELKGKENT